MPIGARLSMLSPPAICATGTGGFAAKCSLPSRPDSSAVTATNISDRFGRGLVAANARPSSISAATPVALSDAPLKIASRAVVRDRQRAEVVPVRRVDEVLRPVARCPRTMPTTLYDCRALDVVAHADACGDAERLRRGSRASPRPASAPRSPRPRARARAARPRASSSPRARAAATAGSSMRRSICGCAAPLRTTSHG